MVARGGEVALAVVLVLGFFFSFMGLLSLAFPEGTSLTDLMRSGEPAVQGAQPRSRSVALNQSGVEEEGTETIALLTRVNREVKDKPSNAITWSDSRPGLPLGDYHSVQTFGRSRATIAFSEESEMRLGENSLVVVRKPAKQAGDERRRASLIVLDGTLQGRIAVGRGGGPVVEIEAATQSARLRAEASTGKPTKFAITVNDNQSSTFSVFGGSAQVVSPRGSITVAPNQSVTVSVDGVFGPALPLPPAPKPMVPQDDARQFYRSTRARTEFRWEASEQADGYVLTVARDPGFLDLVASESAVEPGFTLGNLRAGHYYWRVRAVLAGLEGPESETRGFVIVHQRKPPSLTVEFPDSVVRQPELVLQGKTTPRSKVLVRGAEATVDGAGRFTARINLKRGVNLVVVEAIDEIGNVSFKSGVINATY